MNSIMELHDPTTGSPPCVLCFLSAIQVKGRGVPSFFAYFLVDTRKYEVGSSLEEHYSVWFLTKSFLVSI